MGETANATEPTEPVQPTEPTGPAGTDSATGPAQYNKDVLFQALQAGFVFNVNMLMHQMVSSQHALQQLLTATTARSVSDITKGTSSNPGVLKQSVDMVLKVIDESAALHIKMMNQLTEEAVKCSNAIKQ